MVQHQNQYPCQNVANDAAIAQLLAAEDQELADAELAQRLEARDKAAVTNNSGEHHGGSLYPGARSRPQVPIGTAPPVVTGRPRSIHSPPSSQVSGSSGATGVSPWQSQLQRLQPAPAHMCEVAWILGDGVCVEMMVDSGAQTSVITLALARQLDLESKIDKSHSGVAAGVGRARIVGKITNVICTLGNVEFHMDLMVLDAPDKLLLLGLDLMRKYLCIIDLQKEVLIFGGNGGVEVPMLPAAQQTTHAFRNGLGTQEGCPLM
jgi:hypothetical protein